MVLIWNICESEVQKMVFVVVDNFGDKSEEYETKEEAKEFIMDCLAMELEDDGYIRRKYEIIEVN